MLSHFKCALVGSRRPLEALGDNRQSHRLRHQPKATLGDNFSMDRRGTVLGTILLLGSTAMTAPCAAEAVDRVASSQRGLSAYIKKKALEPLETYVPVVLAARFGSLGWGGL